MTDQEREFARQAAFLANVHLLADRAEEIAGINGAATMLFSAALVALNQMHDIDHAMNIARIWADSLEAQQVKREGTH
ncbi:hypothetical protein [Sphingobium yanoikuyae]|uniref:hypothetical protein n=1 Tax=Sphingobium yanoikuyae TaxID=13690 RepID=UPI000262C3B5|nr:hypothetical protein [Sphingobium yanoikuyae]